MAEHASRSSDYYRHRVRGGLLVGLLVLPCLVLPGLPGLPGFPAAWAGGVGDGALRMTVTVNGRGHSGLRPPAVRVGAQVVKRYRLVNSGEAHLYGVRVVDPAVPAGAVRCPGRTLAALGELECVARFPAVGGARRATARVEGDIPSLRRRLTATARTGYTGVAGGLRLTERVTVRGVGAGSGRGLGVVSGSGSGSVSVAYTVTNRGNRPVHAVRVGDPGLGLAPEALDCGAGGGTVAVLAPGASARCTALVRRPPGTHRSTGLASGSDRVTTYGPGGERLPAPTLTARSSAVFTLPRRTTVAVPKPDPEPKPESESNPSGNGGAPGGLAVPGAPGGAGVAGAPGGAGGAGVAAAPGAPAVAGGAAGAAGAAGAVVAPGAAGAAPAAAAVPVPAPPPPPAPPVPPAVAPDALRPADETAAAAAAGERSGRAPAVSRAAVLDDEGFLGRLRRRGREAHELGIVITLLLLLIPAAIAAALLGNRRG
ncbi:hypothetical protein R1T08_22560 [Streptomyces sp. SBC-4]|nr:hypothetical protein [Streptomyces sp. SBC-4]MDV5146896.1 hypothetical protein [Streptomyces sp. SBC-4]